MLPETAPELGNRPNRPGVDRTKQWRGKPSSLEPQNHSQLPDVPSPAPTNPP